MKNLKKNRGKKRIKYYRMKYGRTNRGGGGGGGRKGGLRGGGGGCGGVEV